MEKDKKKILLLTMEYPPIRGGVSRYYQNLVNYSGLPIDILSSGLFWLWRPKWLPALWKTFHAFKKKKYNYLFVGQVLPLGYVALAIKFFLGVKFAVFTHGMDILLPQKNWWKRWWLKKILRTANLIFANSLFTKKELQKLTVPEKKIKVMHPCVEKKFHGEAAKNGNLILSVGRLVERKGFDMVIKALPQILKQNPRINYVLIGTGPDEERLKRLAKDLNVKEHVVFVKNADDEELEKWYEKADVFIMPCRQIGSDVEGLGTVFLEAASHSLPVVAGNSGGAGEALIDGQTGFLVNPNSLKEIEEAIIQILSNAPKAKAMGEAGKAMIEEKFLCHRQFADLAKIIN